MNESEIKVREALDALLEEELSAVLTGLATLGDPIYLLGLVVEKSYSNGDLNTGDNLINSMSVLIPKLLKMELKGEVAMTPESVDIAAKALSFGLAYYCLRDAIFYSYAEHEPVSFLSDGFTFDVRYRDPTILRQFSLEHHIFVLNSIENKKYNRLDLSETLKLLEGTIEWDIDNPSVQKVMESIDFEAESKMGYLFEYLPRNGENDMGGFSYRQYFTVALELLKLSLYVRYYSKANSLPSVITYSLDELAVATSKGTGIPVKQCVLILRAIARASESTLVYVSSTKILLFAWAFSLKDLLGRGLRDLALRKPDTFVANIAGPIGDALVTEVVDYFNAFRNFRALPEIDLQKYSKTLPDIDILACSYEPSLGFHVFICEAKNNLPGSWAKERLKSVGEDGFITKALDQIAKIKEFLNTSDGNQLLHNEIRKLFKHLDFKTLFPTGFCVTINGLIITSQTCGMFLQEQKISIVSSDLLRHILRASDGDVNYMLACLKELGPTIDQTYEVTNFDATVRNVPVRFDACKPISMLKFSRHSYLSENIDKKLEKDSLQSGYRFIDTIDFSSAQTEEK